MRENLRICPYNELYTHVNRLKNTFSQFSQQITYIENRSAWELSQNLGWIVCSNLHGAFWLQLLESTTDFQNRECINHALSIHLH